MRAIRYLSTGPASEVLDLVRIPIPDPAPSEVRVRIHASGVNPHDTKGRSGWAGVAVPSGGTIPHSDGAGVIEAVGVDVSPSRIGERVYVVGAKTQGTAAEYVCVASNRAIFLPEGITFAQGACIGVPAFTAWLAVLADGPVTGQTVLVQGGGGAVGRVVVELAQRSGARVIATAGSDASRAVARAKGAEIILDRHREDIVAAVMDATHGRGAERIVDVDFGVNYPVDIQVLAPHGTVAAYSSSTERMPVLDYYAFARKSARLDFIQGALLSPAQLARATDCIGAFLGAGMLVPDVAKVFDLAETASAHDMVETGAPANVVVTPQQTDPSFEKKEPSL
ncbi:NADPH:quinone reductase [Alphaproteobacteria bacterium KMM 3653]|uniref:NADPH:quinone reductase n=1 Tax=Harenicola maris TaxID=2841044 RepID=A0AAP2CRZ2_9RHOB|nr:NADPH:quinone reductase [Harenicola maris]